MTSIEALEWRYACKKFNDQKIIPDEKINILMQSFNLTASSYGLQPVKLLVIQNKRLQSELLPSSMNQPQVAQASHLFLFCTHTNIDKDYINEYFDRTINKRGTSPEVLAGFRSAVLKEFGSKSQTEIDQWAAKQAYLALGNMLTVCALEGIDACPMEGFMPHEYDRILDLKSKNLRSVLLMPVGYRADDDPLAVMVKVRKPLAESVLQIN